MNQIWTVAKKELRGYFHSPVALIFLATFLFIVLFHFFWVATFFRRNIADVRPLFESLPWLLIFLVAALTMRLWSEEQRMGTLEILLTLPVKTGRLVIGKFVAGMGLVALALALTICIPFTVAQIGDLDWGPVFGGYAGALLLAAAYLAIGLCISSSTSNPIVALMLTCISCGALYLIGSEKLTAFAGHRGGEILQALGTGSRFESIQRGVIDLRDVLYYASLAGGFLVLNTVLLEAKRWSQGVRTKPRRSAAAMTVMLVLANLAVLNVSMARVRTARVDMTERGEYSISGVTKKLLSELDAPLLIRGYFSAKTHPLLAPLVPRVRDLIEEYAAVGGKRVTVESIDPQSDPALEKEANEEYGIKSVPFQFADRHADTVVNSYFTLLVKYGDKYEKLSFQDLIEVKVTGMKNIEVKLRNLEYDLTRTIKKVVYGFQPLESLFARVSGKVTLTGYISPKTLPDNLKEIPERIQKVADEIKKRSAGKFEYVTVDPHASGDPAVAQELFKKYGLRPMALGLFSNETFYLHLLLKIGDKLERINPTPQMSEADVRAAVTAALKRTAPGFLKTVGLVVAASAPPPQRPNPMMPRPPPPQGPRYQMLRSKLGENYTVKTVDAKKGWVPGDIDVLIVAGIEALDEKQRYAIDQFLMHGGAVIALAGKYHLDLAGMRSGLSVKKSDDKLTDILATWGVEIGDKMVLDPQNEAFPVPVERNVGGFSVREMRMIPYPFWVDVRSDGMAEGSPVVASLPSVTLQWVSPLTVKKDKRVKHTVLMKSTDKAWMQDGSTVQPDFAKHPDKGFAPQGDTKQRILAVSLTGEFASAFKGKPSPLLEKKDEKKDAPSKEAKADGRTLEKSPKAARLVVVGSSDFANDAVLSIARQTGSDRFINSLQFVQNLVDWSVADTDLLTIRSRGTYARTLKPMEETARKKWEYLNYGIALLGLFGIVGIVWLRRRGLKPMPVPADDKREGSK